MHSVSPIQITHYCTPSAAISSRHNGLVYHPELAYTLGYLPRQVNGPSRHVCSTPVPLYYMNNTAKARGHPQERVKEMIDAAAKLNSQLICEASQSQQIACYTYMKAQVSPSTKTTRTLPRCRWLSLILPLSDLQELPAFRGAFPLPPASITPIPKLRTLAQVPSVQQILVASVQLDSVKGTARSSPLRPQCQRECILLRIFFLTDNEIVSAGRELQRGRPNLRQLPGNVVLSTEALVAFLYASKVTWRHHAGAVAGRARHRKWP